MFIGEYNHKIDAKGRVIVPTRFHEDLGESFVITKGLDGCLYIYPTEEWNTFLEKLHALPSGRDTRKLVRSFAASADICEVDAQGRILIKTGLREYAGLTKDVVFAGTLNHIEVWDKAQWEQENSMDDMDDIAEKLADLGLSV
ncbi:MAG TPA: division/cell wall cluster transcriptional repressor MraZ [Lachnospiraceae bacterium]|nr:division/cell wall cluster transcriptional repressor MraZ [Lachnospiraceae bacterium]